MFKDRKVTVGTLLLNLNKYSFENKCHLQKLIKTALN